MRKSGIFRISTVLVVTACLTLMCLGVLIGLNFKNFVTYWGENMEVVVYLEQGVDRSSKDAIVDFLKKQNSIKRWEYFSADQNFKDFTEQASLHLPQFQFDTYVRSLVPESFLITLNEVVPGTERIQIIDHLASSIRDLSGVSEVIYSSEIVEKIGALIDAGVLILYTFSLVLGLAIILIISNLIHSLVNSRREEIAIYELMGATSWMIRKPFFIEASVLGGLCGIIALGLTFLAENLLVKNVLAAHPELFQFGKNLIYYSPAEALIIVLGSSFLGFLAVYFCIRSVNNNWAVLQRTP